MTIDLESLRKIRSRMSEIVQGTHDTRSEALVDLRELISWGHVIDSELTTRRARDAEVGALVAAAQDMLSGWRYIRYRHGDLDGVGWDRAQQAVEYSLLPFTGAKT